MSAASDGADDAVPGPRAPAAVIDVGSNSIRLVVYDRRSRAPVPRLNEKRLCVLGREVARSRNLGGKGQRCAADALRRFVAVARGMGCASIDVVATAAVRMASDGAEWARAIGDELGLPVVILSGPEEARYAALGVVCGFHTPAGWIGDLGGGSVELARLEHGDVAAGGGVSLPLGAITLTDLLADSRARAERALGEALDKVAGFAGAARGGTFHVVGGSWRALARARMAMQDVPLRHVHGYEISGEEAVTLGRTMADLDPNALERVPGVSKRRLETLPAAGMLLERVVSLLAPERVVFSATGLREGRLLASLPDTERARDPLLAGAMELGAATSRLPGVGAAMIRWTEGLLDDEDAALRRLRHAVCHVSDAGWHEHPDTRAREAFFLLAQYPFLGVRHVEHAFIAACVLLRYGGRLDDPAVRRIAQLVGEPHREACERLGAALALGYRVSAGIPAIIDACRLERDGAELVLRAGHPAVQPDDEAIRSRLKSLAAALGLERSRILPTG